MAITLPYPDLVFVPLDKLTAEEMNEIVANYTTIASKVGEAEFYDNLNTSSINIPSYTTFNTVDVSGIENGRGMLVMAQVLVVNNGSSDYANVAAYYNNSNGMIQQVRGQTGGGIVTIIEKFTKVASASNVTLQSQISSPSGNSVSRSYLAVLAV